MKALLRDLVASLGFAAGVTPSRGEQRLTIATFHRVLPAHERDQYPLPTIAVTPEELAWFLDFFKQYFECGPLAQVHERWLAAETTGRPLLAVTFDDAQLDNFRHAKPVLDRARVRATFFVPTEAVETGGLLWHDRAAYAAAELLRADPQVARDFARALGMEGETPPVDFPADVVERLKRESAAARERFISNQEERLGRSAVPAWDGMMTFEQLAVLAAEEHEIGSHSHTHPILTAIDDAALAAELGTSARILEARLGTTPSSFCYPNGDTDQRVTEALVTSPYRRAVTTAWGSNTRGASRYRLRRFDMQSRTARSRRGELSRARLALRMSPFQRHVR